ncbi:MAG: hypothetical protein LBQ31_09820 [Bacteroidales bacterium]|jgi:hypothetical protein|nr:hypothetical protein [Bacteroidales bacterium]
MKKNKQFSKSLLTSSLSVFAVSALFLFLPELGVIRWFLFGSCLCIALLLLFVAGSFLRKKSTPVIIDLTTWQSQIVQFIFIAVAAVLAIYVIPVSYFLFSVILVMMVIAIDVVFMSKMLSISSEKIRYPCHWSIKWDMIINYTLNEEKGILEVHLKDDTHKQIKGIKSKHYPNIREAIDNFFKQIQP